MNMVAETAVQGVSDSDCTVRHAVKRCTASTGSRAAEADYWDAPARLVRPPRRILPRHGVRPVGRGDRVRRVHGAAPVRGDRVPRGHGDGGMWLVVSQERGRCVGSVHVVVVRRAERGKEANMATNNEYDAVRGMVPAGIDCALARISSIVDGVDSSMTVGQIVARAYLAGLSDTLSEFRNVLDGLHSADESLASEASLRALDVMIDRDGRIVSILAHPALDGRSARRADPGFPGAADFEGRDR